MHFYDSLGGSRVFSFSVCGYASRKGLGTTVLECLHHGKTNRLWGWGRKEKLLSLQLKGKCEINFRFFSSDRHQCGEDNIELCGCQMVKWRRNTWVIPRDPDHQYQTWFLYPVEFNHRECKLAGMHIKRWYRILKKFELRT